MTELKILFLMLLAHIIDDFVLQPVCLSNLKQKGWWEKNAPDKIYQHDYIAALIIHSLSWSIMTALPLFFFTKTPDFFYGLMIPLNTLVHAGIDDMKANNKEIDLTIDQIIHVIQIIITWALAIMILKS